ncbi:MAG: hypothetical protein JWM19_1559 [Actinomycetia bacterium]|nr:hypothetical protein [Actinomycetes bacterium]
MRKPLAVSRVLATVAVAVGLVLGAVSAPLAAQASPAAAASPASAPQSPGGTIAESAATCANNACTVTYTTVGTSTFTVPAGVSTVLITATGADGGNVYTEIGPSYGGKAQGVAAVAQGEVLQVNVGGQGQEPFAPGGSFAGGFNGGGPAGTIGGGIGGGGGGGASDVRVPAADGSYPLASRIVVGGGGGGNGYCYVYIIAGGAGGGTTGSNGTSCINDAATAGGGGTQAAGGAGQPGDGEPGDSGQSGSFGQGGAGGPGAGGGGGGWYGGGGGSTVEGNNSAGGGGSGYLAPDVYGITNAGGVDAGNNGNGEVTIAYSTLAPTVTRLYSGENSTCTFGQSVLGCWGLNDNGQSQPPATLFQQVSLGGTDFGCGIRLSDSSVQCWGANTGPSSGQASPPAGAFSSVYAMYHHACAISGSYLLGQPGPVQCWGSDDEGQSDPPSGDFTALSGGFEFTCGLHPDGTAQCWGDPSYAAPTGATFTSIASGSYSTCGITTSQGIDCWGTSDIAGDLDAPTTGQYTAIAAQGTHACALTTAGTIVCWGDNGTDAPPPAGSGYTAISTGIGFTCGLQGGTVSCTQNLGLPAGEALPVITFNSSSPTVGQPFSTPVSVSFESLPPAYSATGLPPGLTIDPSTGIISGTPTASGQYYATVTASDGGYAPDATALVPMDVAAAPTTTAVTDTSIPSGFGSVTYTATVTTSSPSVSPVNSGQVEFVVYDANGKVMPQVSTLEGPVTVVNGKATVSGNFGYNWAPGAYTLGAVYLGNSTYALSRAYGTLIVTGGGSSVASITSATASGGTVTAATPLAAGQAVPDVSATVSGTGTVTVAEYGSDPESAPVPDAGTYFDVHLSANNSLTSATITRCNVGAGNTTAYWWNGTAWSPASPQSYSQATGCITVGPLAASGTSPTLGQLNGTPMVDAQAEPTQLSVSPAAGQYGGSAELSATVSPGPGFTAAGTIAGTVQFSAGGQVLGTATVGSSGVASTAATLTAGASTKSLTATFTPAAGSGYAASTGTAPLSISPAPLTITASNATRAYGLANPPFSVTASGLVNGDTLASLQGTLTFTTTATASSAPGAYQVTPGGLSSPDYTIAYQPGTLTIAPNSAVVTLKSAANPAQFGQKLTFTATVTPAGQGAGTPTGTVTFYDGTAALATVRLSSGTASLTTSALPGGSASLTAQYSGDANFSSGTSAGLTESVMFTAAISGTNTGALTIKSGQSVLVTGTVSGPVTVQAGGALAVLGGKLSGALQVTGAAGIMLCGATISGPVSISNSAGYIQLGGKDAAGSCAADTFAGPVALSGNTDGLQLDGNTIAGPVSVTNTSGSDPLAPALSALIAANTIVGPLACSGNNPAPTSGSQPNTVDGPRSGQCAVTGM